MSQSELADVLTRIDGKGYGAYRTLQGAWAFPTFRLEIRRVQSDPFASPSRCAVLLTADHAGLPARALSTEPARTAVSCVMARRFEMLARKVGRGQGSGRSGEISIVDLEQLVLPHTGVRIGGDGSVEARFGLGLPARGRRVMGHQARDLLTGVLPRLVEDSLAAGAYDPSVLESAADANEDAEALRDQLRDRGLVAFLAEGSALPRRSGVDQRPLDPDRAVPLTVPDSLSVTLDRPNGGPVRGLGIPSGVTLLVGGGYHGKSTVLEALTRGVYNHVPGDGRELVVSLPSAMKIQAEDGRAVTGVDISPFISDLPGGVETRSFSTSNASGSTSQAAGIAEAVEAGAELLLIDEDTAATNFMIRDRRMQALIPKSREPITPLVDRVRSLHRELGVSTVLVIGGSGDYLDVADTVIGMLEYHPQDLTAGAREVARRLPTGRDPEVSGPLEFVLGRDPDPRSLDPIGRGGRPRARGRGPRSIELGRERIDLGAVAGLVLPAQTQAVARALVRLGELSGSRDGAKNLQALLKALVEEVEGRGLDALDERKPGDLAHFRPQDVAAAVNRLRTLRLLE